MENGNNYQVTFTKGGLDGVGDGGLPVKITTRIPIDLAITGSGVLINGELYCANQREIERIGSLWVRKYRGICT